MIEIMIDFNNDELIIDNGSEREEKLVLIHVLQAEYILKKVLDRIMHSGESVCLTKCDEHTKYRIEDW